MAPPRGDRRGAAARRHDDELARGEGLVEELLQLEATQDDELRLLLIEPHHLGAAIAQHLAETQTQTLRTSGPACTIASPWASCSTCTYASVQVEARARQSRSSSQPSTVGIWTFVPGRFTRRDAP